MMADIYQYNSEGEEEPLSRDQLENLIPLGFPFALVLINFP